MKKFFALLGMAAMVFSTSAANADTFTVDVNQSWTSTTLFTVDFDFPSNGFEIASINSIHIDITHSFASDLGFELNGPGGNYNLIDTRTAGGGADVNGLTWVESGGATAYNLDANGNVVDEPYNAASWGSGGPKEGWSIEVEDDFGGDGGTVNSITIDFDKTQIPEPVSGLALLALGTVVAIRRRR